MLAERRAIARLQARIGALQEMIARHEAAAGRIQERMSALDVSISMLHPAIGEDRPAPVNAWQGRFGARGGLREFVLDKLREAAPEPIVTSIVCNQLAERFKLDISVSRLRRHAGNSVKDTLRALAKQGLVERVPTKHPKSDPGLWRLRKISHLDQLRSLASAPESGHDPPVDAPGSQVDRQ